MAEGDESSLAALYDELSDRVHALAFWILRDADEAEDVVEETFWQAWHTANQYDGRRASASGWVVMIARSRALDRLRARRRRAVWTEAAATADQLVGRIAEGGPGVTHLDGLERRAALDSALRALPLDQRQAVELAFFGGLSHSEIAERTAQPLGTVKTRIRLAMQKLRQGLAFLAEDGH